MTQDEIIDMAREAGFFVKDNDAYSPSVQEDHELTPFLVAFANLVAAKAVANLDRIPLYTKDTFLQLIKELRPPSSHWKVWARARPQMNGLIFW
jgi:hypothetical protein